MEPGAPPQLAVRTREMPRVAAKQVLVRVEATSVNPIDAKRAAGYGRRVLALKGAAAFPLVLGNDLAGTVEAVGAGVPGLAPGRRVFGVVATGKDGGAHASHVVVPQEQLVEAPEGFDPQALAVLPYSFTTMWLAVQSTGLVASNAAGMRVLVNGASGALGRLALRVLSAWGSVVTAICGNGRANDCLAAGAKLAVERGPATIAALPPEFHIVLNFGSWDDDPALASRLAPDGLGHATSVHPLLANFDRLGWVQGALTSRREWKAARSAVARRAPKARYNWTLFKPDRGALVALALGVRERRFSLPIASGWPLRQASAAFAHVAMSKSGRAVLLP